MTTRHTRNPNRPQPSRQHIFNRHHPIRRTITQILHPQHHFPNPTTNQHRRTPTRRHTPPHRTPTRPRQPHQHQTPNPTTHQPPNHPATTATASSANVPSSTTPPNNTPLSPLLHNPLTKPSTGARFTHTPPVPRALLAARLHRTRELPRPDLRRTLHPPHHRVCNIALPGKQGARRRTKNRRRRHRRRTTRISRHTRRRRQHFHRTRRTRAAHVRVIHVNRGISISPGKTFTRQKEHIITRFTRIHKHRLPHRAPRRHKAQTPPRHATKPATSRRTTTNTSRLPLIHILITIHITRHQTTSRIKKHPPRTRQKPRLIQSLRQFILLKRRHTSRQPLTIPPHIPVASHQPFPHRRVFHAFRARTRTRTRHTHNAPRPPSRFSVIRINLLIRHPTHHITIIIPRQRPIRHKHNHPPHSPRSQPRKIRLITSVPVREIITRQHPHQPRRTPPRGPIMHHIQITRRTHRRPCTLTATRTRTLRARTRKHTIRHKIHPRTITTKPTHRTLHRRRHPTSRRRQIRKHTTQATRTRTDIAHVQVRLPRFRTRIQRQPLLISEKHPVTIPRSTLKHRRHRPPTTRTRHRHIQPQRHTPHHITHKQPTITLRPKHPRPIQRHRPTTNRISVLFFEPETRYHGRWVVSFSGTNQRKALCRRSFLRPLIELTNARRRHRRSQGYS